MTITTDAPVDHDGGTEWEPRGHPVRWALGVVTLLVAACLASIWFGALTPRVDVDPLTWGGDLHSDRRYVVVDVTNDAHSAVRLVGAGESLPGLELTATEVGPDDGDVLRDGDLPELDGPVTIAPGETVAVVLRYRITDCERVPGDPPAIPIELRTVLGRTHTVGVDDLELPSDGVPAPWTLSTLHGSCPAGQAG
jgi:hypothetical protein